MKTIIYITNNVLDKNIFKLCQKNILESIGDVRLISVSQKPMDFGENICVGKLKRSSLSINLQMMEALNEVTTDYIAIAEHDCLYTPEHFNFTPPTKDVFYYNENVWCLQYCGNRETHSDGMFSTFPKRVANSQLICGTRKMKEATQERIDIMSHPEWLKRYPTGRIGEAGSMTLKHVKRLASATKTKEREKLKRYVLKYKAEFFNTKLPNIDIKHNDNLTKNRRGYNRRFKLPYWGTMQDIFKWI